MKTKFFLIVTLVFPIIFVSLPPPLFAQNDKPFFKRDNPFFSKMDHLRPKVISVDGVEREYYLHRSNRGKFTKNPLPTIFVLHGGADTAEKIRQRMLFDELANREGFNVVYPQGFQKSWNDGRPDSARFRSTGESPPDDIAFFKALMNELIQQGITNPNRVYFTGPSNGGMMSMRVGCELSDRVTAIAPMIANMPEELGVSCRPAQPIPVLIMNGTKDQLMPWEGGAVGGKPEKSIVWSTLQTVEFWKKNNRCETSQTINLPDWDQTDGSTVEVSLYQSCLNKTEVQLYRLIGAGHTVPGGKAPRFPRLVKRLFGNKNNDIDARIILWNFFKTYQSHLK